jgi:hypothetical protein
MVDAISSGATNEILMVRPGVRPRLSRTIDGLGIAVAVSLPWSTSATGILIALWIVAYLPTLDLADLRRVVTTPAGALPVLLWILSVLGMLWADVSWGDRFAGVGSFHRLLLIPLLLAHYCRSENGWRVVTSYLVSCIVLIGLSLATTLWPGIWRPDNPGVPMHDQIAQSAEFVMCAFALSYLVFEAWHAQEPGRAAAILLLALAFLADVIFVATSRTELVVIAVLMVLATIRQWGFKGTVPGLAAFAALAMVAWSTSPYLRGRVEHGLWEVQQYRTNDRPTSIGARLEWWQRSIDLVNRAPLIGHGTGSIKSLFADDAQTPAAFRTANPHNQMIVIALQLGLLGTAALFAMWLSHLLLFRGAGLYAWIGLVVVVQNVVGSLFNSHLFDFVEGWTYVWGVGVIGGIVLRGRSAAVASSPLLTRSDPRPANLPPGQELSDR